MAAFFSCMSPQNYDSSRISRPGNFSFQYANLLESRTVITVRRSRRTLMLGCSSFSDFFLRAMNLGFRGRASFCALIHVKRTHTVPKKLSDVQKLALDVKETSRIRHVWTSARAHLDSWGTNRPEYHAMYK